MPACESGPIHQPPGRDSRDLCVPGANLVLNTPETGRMSQIETRRRRNKGKGDRIQGKRVWEGDADRVEGGEVAHGGDDEGLLARVCAEVVAHELVVRCMQTAQSVTPLAGDMPTACMVSQPSSRHALECSSAQAVWRHEARIHRRSSRAKAGAVGFGGGRSGMMFWQECGAGGVECNVWKLCRECGCVPQSREAMVSLASCQSSLAS